MPFASKPVCVIVRLLYVWAPSTPNAPTVSVPVTEGEAP